MGPWIRAAIASAIAALLVSCAPVGTPFAAPRPSPVPRPAPTSTAVPATGVVLPRDEAPHQDLTEWWYYTGHMVSKHGAYGFELVMFQVRRGDNPPGYAAHFAITDHQRRQFVFAQKESTGEQPHAGPGFRLHIGNWTMDGQQGVDHVAASYGGYRYQLTLHSTKPAALEGGTGLISFGTAGDSYYYSRTHMTLAGTLNDHGVRQHVTGLAWMDHQWGNFVVSSRGGWDWYSVQLSNDTELMLSVVRATGGKVAPYGTVVDRRGRSTTLPASDFQTQQIGHWTSPRTGITYPSGWRIRIRQPALDLTLEPVLRDQELVLGSAPGNSYWEGEVTATGSSTTGPVHGVGYVELTGYQRASP